MSDKIQREIGFFDMRDCSTTGCAALVEKCLYCHEIFYSLRLKNKCGPFSMTWLISKN